MATISVVIPCYNQSRYLRLALSSVLAQTRPADEIIVVDDGSTDDTAQVAAEFKESVRYIWQANQGLAGARNTAIVQATGEYIAFLDSDDEWLPGFLESMLTLIAENPNAAVFYCCAQCIDSDGKLLPQLAGAKLVPSARLYQTLLEANFIIPSTVLVRRDVLIANGCFDQLYRDINGCEDWDLWLRLARTYEFAGTLNCWVRYRIHSASMSVEVDKMLAAALAVIEKHFGPESEPLEQWSDQKRLAYAVIYRHKVLTYVIRRGNWQAATQPLRRSLHLRPALATDPDLFYELALGTQPIGFRGTSDRLDLEQNARHLRTLLDEVFTQRDDDVTLTQLKSKTYGTAYYALGLVAYNTGSWSASRHYLIASWCYHPQQWRNAQLWSAIAKSFLGGPILAVLKRRSSLPTRT